MSPYLVLYSLPSESLFTLSTRWASKKAGGSSKNPKGHAPGKRRGFKVSDGEHVTQGSVLLKQLNVRCLPGLNVNSLLSLNQLPKL